MIWQKERICLMESTASSRTADDAELSNNVQIAATSWSKYEIRHCIIQLHWNLMYWTEIIKLQAFYSVTDTVSRHSYFQICFWISLKKEKKNENDWIELCNVRLSTTPTRSGLRAWECREEGNDVAVTAALDYSQGVFVLCWTNFLLIHACNAGAKWTTE